MRATDRPARQILVQELAILSCTHEIPRGKRTFSMSFDPLNPNMKVFLQENYYKLFKI